MTCMPRLRQLRRLVRFWDSLTFLCRTHVSLSWENACERLGPTGPSRSRRNPNSVYWRSTG